MEKFPCSLPVALSHPTNPAITIEKIIFSLELVWRLNTLFIIDRINHYQKKIKLIDRMQKIKYVSCFYNPHGGAVGLLRSAPGLYQ